MAIVTPNSPFKNISGLLGPDIVFKKYKDKTVVSVKPAPRKHNSPLQQLSCNRFREAARHARTILRDPVKRSHYQNLARKQNKHSAYNVIISEYMTSVNVNTKKIKTTTKRLTLSVTKKDFKLKEVNVELTSPQGRLLATGKANRINTTDWIYKLPDTAPDSYTITVIVTDALNQVTRQHITHSIHT